MASHILIAAQLSRWLLARFYPVNARKDSLRKMPLKKNSHRIFEGAILILNTLSILVLLIIILNDFVRSQEGQYMTWIYLTGSGGNWATYFGVQIIPLVAVATIFLVTQVYLNFRLLRTNRRQPQDDKTSIDRA